MIFLGIFIWLYFKNIDILVKILGTSIFYRIDRIINFKNNYQLQNALICIGTTGFWGRNNKPMIYIPESVTDFMFARVISIFGLIILSIYLLLSKVIPSDNVNNFFTPSSIPIIELGIKYLFLTSFILYNTDT